MENKILITTILILVLIISIPFLLFSFVFRNEKQIDGYVLDCETESPIGNAEVSVNQRGWGTHNGQLVWDKDYTTVTTSDDSGYFVISYRVGSSAHIQVKKSGFINAEQWEYPGTITVKILRGDKPTEMTNYCKVSSECLSCIIENGIQVCRNTCIKYD